jgi:hypothetical protein
VAGCGRRGDAGSEGRGNNSNAESIAVSGRISGDEANSVAEANTGSEDRSSSESSPGNDAAN